MEFYFNHDHDLHWTVSTTHSVFVDFLDDFLLIFLCQRPLQWWYKRREIQTLLRHNRDRWTNQTDNCHTAGRILLWCQTPLKLSDWWEYLTNGNMTKLTICPEDACSINKESKQNRSWQCSKQSNDDFLNTQSKRLLLPRNTLQHRHCCWHLYPKV